ncbi:MAG TPA: CRTAC1 family protein, partial [Chthonomonadaceae bacterium]|nr:CRTAC1 family protein [Chthonomonadaceae bacterium]
RLFHNEGGKRFVEVTGQAGVGDGGWSTSAAWLDYDNDGKLDLFVCHYLKWSPQTDIPCTAKGFKSYCRPQEYRGESCRLFHNEGGGRFRDVTRQAGLWNESAKALGVLTVDLDGDGRQDLVVANDMEPNFVYHNNGNGTFTEVGFQTGISFDESGRARAGMGIDAADVNNDGTLGLAVGNFSFEGLGFYLIAGAPPYSDRAKQAGLYAPSYPYVTFGLFFADFDNDGWQDLFITNGHIEDTVSLSSPGQTYPQPCILFRNLGNGAFADVSREAGAAVTQPLVGRGACRADFDNDGRPDILLIPNVGAPRLLHNETPTRNHWLTVRLIGTRSNRNAYGARVVVKVGGRTQTAYAHSGSSYLSASDARLAFGLGAAARVDSVAVRWPSGRRQEWTNLAPDRIYQLIEGAAEARPQSVTLAHSRE